MIRYVRLLGLVAAISLLIPSLTGCEISAKGLFDQIAQATEPQDSRDSEPPIANQAQPVPRSPFAQEVARVEPAGSSALPAQLYAITREVAAYWQREYALGQSSEAVHSRLGNPSYRGDGIDTYIIQTDDPYRAPARLNVLYSFDPGLCKHNPYAACATSWWVEH